MKGRSTPKRFRGLELVDKDGDVWVYNTNTDTWYSQTPRPAMYGLSFQRIARRWGPLIDAASDTLVCM